MKINKSVKESFTVIGKEGSTSDGEAFISKLWENANAHFGEVEHLAKKDENGNLCGIWGAMSDFSRSFMPWEGFPRGFILREWSAMMRQRRRMDGQNGEFPVTSTSMWNVKGRMFSRKYWST